MRPPRAGSVDGKRNFGQTLRQYAAPSGFLGQVGQRRRTEIPAPDPPFVDQAGDPLPASIHRDNWVVACPTEGCGDVSFVWLDEPLYMCANCFNEEVGGRWRRVQVPPAGEREQIEAVLGQRVLPQQRNWDPAETVGELEAQNREHGDPVPQEEA